ncbi:MAG: helix-turn-helix domain-containing protein [Candidatus Thorarchaeota archaeon]|nr:MAG: helix-turn-helix domain-containing protein [Candidatus Thorarchaeota archaeon]
MPMSARDRFARRIAGEIALSEHPGQAMRVWRKRFRLPQVVLSKYLGISPSVISDYESGRRKSPGTATIRRFVMALLTLDERNGGTAVSAFVRLMDINLIDLNVVIAMNDFATAIKAREFCNRLKCEVLSGEDLLERNLYGYTLVDIERAIKELSSEAFMKLFGATTERCLIFTNASTGRAPLIAIKTQEFRPSLVVLHGVGEIDALTIELSEQMRIPLAVSKIKSVDALVKELRTITPD